MSWLREDEEEDDDDDDDDDDNKEGRIAQLEGSYTYCDVLPGSWRIE